LVLTLNKTIDLMRQVREMLASAIPDHPLRESLHEAERMVKRDIVEQSLTLGIMPVSVDDEPTDEADTQLDTPAIASDGEGA
jgi:ATP-dependent RNA helicase HelY